MERMASKLRTFRKKTESVSLLMKASCVSVSGLTQVTKMADTPAREELVLSSAQMLLSVSLTIIN